MKINIYYILKQLFTSYEKQNQLDICFSFEQSQL